MRDCSSKCFTMQGFPTLPPLSDLLYDSLLLDDIEDSSILRRGLPVAHKIFGEVLISLLYILHIFDHQASTINCANYVMFIGLERTLALGHPEAVNVFTQQLLELHRGQVTKWRIVSTAWQTILRAWRYIGGITFFVQLRRSIGLWSAERPVWNQMKKTHESLLYDPGGLFNLAVRLMQLFSSSDQNFTELTRCDSIKSQLCQTQFF